MKIKTKLKGIEFKSLLIILIFNIGIILFICFYVTFIFNNLYKNHQIRKLNTIVETLSQNKEDTYVASEKLAYENEVCIKVIDSNNVAYNFNTMQKGCILIRKMVMKQW